MTSTTSSPLVAVCRDWIEANLHHFAIDWKAESAEILRRLKPYAELGLLISIDKTTPSPELYQIRSMLIQWASENAPNPESLERITIEFPQAFPWVGMIWLHRSRIGIRESQLRQVVEHLGTNRSVIFYERPAGHDIALYNVMRALNRDPPFTLRDLYSRTMLANKAWDHPSDTALYCICHDIFFLTDWGTRQLPEFMLARETWFSKLQEWHAACASNGKVDLAAELSLAISFMSEAWAVPSASARVVPLNELGLPAPPKGQGTGFIQRGDSDASIKFFQNYHTVLVCLLALGRGWALQPC